jgi:hypothetical protein
MPLQSSYPRIDDLLAAPQLAVLALLEAAADVTLVALVAADPDDYGDEHAAPERLAARALADAARDVVSAVNRYRLALAIAAERDRDDLLPF